MNTRHLLESLCEDEQDNMDLALDFIEHEVGGSRLGRNWAAMKSKGDIAERVSHWMQKIGANGDASVLVKLIDELAAKDTYWLTPFTSPIPPEDVVLPSLKQKSTKRK